MSEAHSIFPSSEDNSRSVATSYSKICIQKPSVPTSLVDVTHILQEKMNLPCRILFKNEYEQPSGSFKLRGIGNLIQKSIQNAVSRGSMGIRVFASSGGNAGLAAAYSSKFYNTECTVVVPFGTSPHVIHELKNYGSQVILHGSTIGEADEHARELLTAAKRDGVCTIYCHPFDNPLIWQGHSEIISEIFSQLPKSQHEDVKGVVCSVGGGGLYNGIMSGLIARGSTADCILVETKQAPTLTKAVEAGMVVRLNSVKSLASSLACSYVSQPTLELFQNQTRNKSHLTTVDDIDAIKAALSYFDDFGTIVEPACGAALSMVYNQLSFLRESLPNLKKNDIVVVVVCGGSCANEKTLAGFRKMLRESHI